ncbi:hypothetical protein OAL10_08140 [Gammaproteobacteria bacterium]|nr:hypothetical protein [Gammaproteobacteria bacterium]
MDYGATGVSSRSTNAVIMVTGENSNTDVAISGDKDNNADSIITL